jgi:hypothetical protein
LNARHGTRATFLFLQMQGFLQERGYVNLARGSSSARTRL